MALRPLKSFLPTADDVLNCDLPRLGGILLMHLKSYEGLGTVYQQIGGINREYCFAMMEHRNMGLGPLPGNGPEFGPRQPEVSNAVREAWNWLEKEGHLMHTAGQPSADWFSFTRSGEKLLKKSIKFEQWDKLGPDRVKHGLQNDPLGFIGGTPEVREWAGEWVKSHENKARQSEASTGGPPSEGAPVGGASGASPLFSGTSSAERLLVFLCHSSGDKAAVRELYAKLKRDEFRPWLDEEDLLPGHDWDDEIRRAVRASHVVVVCLSASSITKEGYVQKEIKLALDVADEKPQGHIFLIPARLEECEMPERLSRWHRVDLFASNGYDRLVAALKERDQQRRARPALEKTCPSASSASKVLEAEKHPLLAFSDFAQVGLGTHPSGQSIDAPQGFAYFVTNSQHEYETIAQNLKATLTLRSADGQEIHIESAPWFHNTGTVPFGHFFYAQTSLGMSEKAGIVCAVRRDSRFYAALYASDSTVGEGQRLSFGAWELDLKIAGDNTQKQFKGKLRLLPAGSISLEPFE